MKIPNIAKNTSYFTLALILQKVISFSYFIIIARAIGPENLGKYYFAISFTTIFAIFVDIGMSSVLIREIAKHKSMAENYFCNVLGIKLVLSLFSFLCVFLLINLMGYPQITKDLVYLSSIAMILDSFTLTFFAVSRGFHNLSFESISVVFYQIILLSLGVFFLKTGLGLRWLISATVFASSAHFIYSGSLIIFKWKLKVWPKINLEILREIIRIALPFAFFGIFQRLYTYFDSVLLSLLAGDRYVGLYSVAFKITFALQFLPLAFVASLFPAMSNYYINNKRELAIIFERAMNYLIIISLPISVGIIILADIIVLIFKSDYSGSILPLQIIIASLFFIFITYPVGSLLNACDRQKTNTINMGITLAVSIGLNFILIPKFQAVGASITVLATNVLLLSLGIFWVPKIINYNPIIILKAFLKSLLSVFLMGGILWNFKESINLFVLIPLGGIVYFGFLYTIRGFTKEDIRSIVKSFAGK